jgi:hypothetical protein
MSGAEVIAHGPYGPPTTWTVTYDGTRYLVTVCMDPVPEITELREIFLDEFGEEIGLAPTEERLMVGYPGYGIDDSDAYDAITAEIARAIGAEISALGLSR